VFTLINKLKTRPEAYRKKVSLILSLTVTAIIVVVWASTFGAGFTGVYNEEAEVNNVAATATPFTTFKDDILRIKDGFVGVFDSLGGVNYSAKEVQE